MSCRSLRPSAEPTARSRHPPPEELPVSLPLSGLLVLDKPAGVTSYDCVARVKRVSAQSRVGHAGTLDPLATGVLLTLLGDATRRQAELLELEKEYRFKARFGAITET